MSDQKEEVDNLEKSQSFVGKKLEGKFLTHVWPKDLDADGRFVCNEPVILIGAHAFDDVRDKLTYVKVDGVISIENEAFANCTKLEKADIGFGLGYKYPENYDYHMFFKDRKIDSEDDYYDLLNEYVEKYGQYEVHIKDGAFKNCTSLKSFYFPSGATLYDSPFENCTSLEELTFDGIIYYQINEELLDALDAFEEPLQNITFKNCRKIEILNFGTETTMNYDDIASFGNLKKINLKCNFADRRKFWHGIISRYPEFLLILPTDLFRDSRFLMKCLASVPRTLEEIYGYPACKQIYKNLLSKKIKIEKEKAKPRQKEMKSQRQQNDIKIAKNKMK